MAIDGINYDGTGYFKFAFVDNGTENVRTATVTPAVNPRQRWH